MMTAGISSSKFQFINEDKRKVFNRVSSTIPTFPKYNHDQRNIDLSTKIPYQSLMLVLSANHKLTASVQLDCICHSQH